jgi:hypothetical protein
MDMEVSKDLKRRRGISSTLLYAMKGEIWKN